VRRNEEGRSHLWCTFCREQWKEMIEWHNNIHRAHFTKLFFARFVQICSQVHQHFMSSFFANILAQKNYKSKLLLKKSFAKHFGTKRRALNVDDIDTCSTCFFPQFVKRSILVNKYKCVTGPHRNNKALHSELELECLSRNSSQNEFFAIFEVRF
jgi:hypothetical protein